MATGEVKYFHVTRVKMFHGSKEEGRQAAMLDADQYVVRRILAWKGSPTERSYMWFKVEYEDGDILWQEFTQDLFACQAMEDFVNSQRPLFLLRFPANMANARRAELNRTDITEVRPGDKVYVDLRRWGEAWYDQLGLPDAYETIHVVECQYTHWQGRGKRKINLSCKLFDEVVLLDAYEVYCYGSERQLKPTMTLVTERMAVLYPDILPEDPKKRAALLRAFKAST